MSLLDFFRRRIPKGPAAGPPLLQRLLARPSGGGDAPEEGEAERRIGERFAAELHAYGAVEPIGLGRRAAAVASAARRRRSAELAEALDGLQPWEVPSLLEALEGRRDVDRPALLRLARELADFAGSWEMLGAALGLLGLGPAAEDLELLEAAARSEALTGICAMSAEPLGAEAVLAIARAGRGLGRALALERLALACADRQEELAPLALEAVELAASVEDETARAYAAVPILEVADGPGILAAAPSLGEALAACLEAASRGGWNGGPGPGLGRLPGSIRAAEALLGSDAALAIRQRAARAVLASHPHPPGPVRKQAESLMNDM